MKKLTEKQQEFVNQRAHGVKPRAAAVAAGFSANSANVQASQLGARADIKAAITAAKKAMRANGVSVPKDEAETDNKYAMPRKHYSDSKDFLLDAMNHKHLPINVRGDYAKALLPYQHARIGEEGKKEKAKTRARDVAGGGPAAKRNKFAPKQPPALRIVGGKAT
jgi:phage terminase small subunit